MAVKQCKSRGRRTSIAAPQTPLITDADALVDREVLFTDADDDRREGVLLEHRATSTGVPLGVSAHSKAAPSSLGFEHRVIGDAQALK
jgi:hypothetical protein